MTKFKCWQQLLLLVILMQPCYLSRRAHAVCFSPPLWGGSSPPEHIYHWGHCYLPTLPKLVELADCKAIFIFLNQANLIWKPHSFINVGFHNTACTELLFRIELCFNCWELFHHSNLASAVRQASCYIAQDTQTQRVCSAQRVWGCRQVLSL